MQARRHHAADDRGAHDLARHRPRARRGPQWHAAQDEGKRGHQNRPQAQPGAFERGVRQRLSFFEFVLGELDDQNRVLRRQADEHHQPDLRVNIIFDLDHVGRHKVAERQCGAATIRRRRRRPLPACSAAH